MSEVNGEVNAFNLGDRLRDRVSGFAGIAVSRVLYLNGCIQYELKPPVDKEGKSVDSRWIDDQQLERVDHGINDKPVKPKRTGGPDGSVPSSAAGAPS